MYLNYENIKNDIEKTRDNLKLKSHLFASDAQEIWKDTELKWHGFEKNYDNLKDSSKESSRHIKASLDLLENEINEGYKKIDLCLKYGV
jgi:hypothetical protein